ncbi:MAG: biopolymer transporter ExbD [Bacteroidales bacterium]|nr:biopolymer transporter ExbD [Bacteroidales bacterium]
MARKTPGLNTSSMSDISFLLLAFFLMVSNINTDMGIARRLPPPLPDNVDPPYVKHRNIFTVLVNKDDRLLYNNEYGRISDLKDRVKEFLGNPDNLPNLPEKTPVDIPGLGMYEVSKGVISLRNDRGTSYDMYLQVQNELTAAINEMRDELATTRFGKHYSDLNKEQHKAIEMAIPVAISEAEPTKIGAK